MSELIEDFKKEHYEIIETLKEVEELGAFTEEGHAKLMSLTRLSLFEVFWRAKSL